MKSDMKSEERAGERVLALKLEIQLEHVWLATTKKDTGPRTVKRIGHIHYHLFYNMTIRWLFKNINKNALLATKNINYCTLYLITL